jgi:hypothetical protein
MTFTIKQLQNYAWMSQASYLDYNGLQSNDPDLFKIKLINPSINSIKEVRLN